MKSFDLINVVNIELSNKGINSHSEINDLPMEYIDKLFNDSRISSWLKVDVKNYLDLLFYNTQYTCYKGLILDRMIESNLDWNAKYLLARYAGNGKDDGYRNLPLLIKQLINKLNIEEYKNLTINSLIAAIYSCQDMKQYQKNDRLICEVEGKFQNDVYKKYDSSYDFNSVNTNNKEEFYVWAEHRIFDEEKNRLYNHPSCRSVTWVSREFGDGYGYDVLSFNPINNKQKFIEVKSGRSEGFVMTEREVEVMRNCQFKNVEYYIPKWTYSSFDNLIKLNIYMYNPTYDILIDQNNNCYSLKEYQEEEYYRGIVTKYYPEKIDKEKILIKN